MTMSTIQERERLAMLYAYLRILSDEDLMRVARTWYDLDAVQFADQELDCRQNKRIEDALGRMPNL